MTDTSFGASYDNTPPAGPVSVGGAPLSPAPMPAAPASSPTPQPGVLQQFGSALNTVLGGPNYTAPDPTATALDQTADTLQQRIKRANAIATNPIAQFLNPEDTAAARAFVPQATEQLQKIQQQKAQMQANRTEAETLGFSPGEVADEATQADRVALAQSKALKGDMRAFQGLAAVKPEAAAAIQDQVHEAVAGHLDKAQSAYDQLANVKNAGEYDAKVKQLRSDGTITDLEALGMKVPRNFDAFSASKGAEGKTLREARVAIDNLKAGLEERANGQVMEKKEAEGYKGRLTTSYGDELNNGTWSRVNGKRAFAVNGQGDVNDLGKKFTYASPDQRKAILEDMDKTVPKEEREKNRAFGRTYELATHDGKGNAMPEGTVNTNPNVQQGMAEGLASMLRGGNGGANVGLLKIETNKRGFLQGLVDKISTEKGAVINEIKGADVNPYLSKLTQTQIRDVLDAIKQYNDVSIGNRLTPIAKRAGALGLDATALGFGPGEAKGVESQLEAGRQDTIARFKERSRPTAGGDGAIYLDTPPSLLVTKPDVPGTVHAPVPPPVAPAPTALPGAGTTPPPAPGQTGAGGGGGPPVQVAGQSVNFAPPPGASPNFLPALQRIESGNEKDPWTAGNDKSSAKGAFQFINDTWKANRPAGAPDDPRKATPAQQTQALEKLTASNAATLQHLKIPVNDTTLYIAHNLGAGGAGSLFTSSPTADARSVVGDVAASNNPAFFKGRPIVATVLQRYSDAMAGGAEGGQRSTGGGATASFWDKLTGRAPGETASLEGTGIQGDRIATPQERASSPVVENAPAIGSTIGALATGATGPGAVAGGAVGGGAGQAFKDWMQGREQSPAAIAKQSALGGVLGIASEARPLLAAGARVLGAGGVEAGDIALNGGDSGDIAGKALEGGAYALGGEALGRFVSSAGAGAYKALSRYTTSAQSELSARAGELAEARKVLETEQPKLPGDAGANPKYEAAKAKAEAATKAIEDHGQKPDDMVHAYEQASGPLPVSKGEAAVLRKAASERADVGRGYDELRSNVQESGVGAPRPNQPLADGPRSMLRTADNPAGKVEAKFAPDAEHAEMLIKAPAKDWGQKWQQLQDAGSELIRKRLDFLATGDKTSAKAMDTLFDGVRNQQKKAAEYVFGPEKGKQAIGYLENLDKRYARVMTATQGMDYGKMRSVIQAGNTPERRDLEKNFMSFAKDDPGAIRAFNAMKAGAQGRISEEAKLMLPVIAGEAAANLHGIPTIGVVSAAIAGQRIYKMMQEYMNAKLLSKSVKFADFLTNEIKKNGFSGTTSAVQHAAVQGAQ